MKTDNIHNQLRPAIAMIELIFALVIIGITLASAPLLISTSSKSSFVALQQESIAAAAAQMNIMMSSLWDNADTNSSIGEPTLTTDSTILNQCTVATHPVGNTSDSGRYCSLSGTTYPASATIGTEGTTGELLSYDDIDDYNNQNYTVSIYSGDTYSTSSGDYIDKNINIASQVYYGDDTPKTAANASRTYGESITFSNPFRTTNPVVGTTNIKIFSVTLTSTNVATEVSDKTITLSAFMCNIGAPKEFISNESSL